MMGWSICVSVSVSAYIICVLFYQFTNVWPESDLFLLIIFFFLYVLSIISFGFLVRYLCRLLL